MVPTINHALGRVESIRRLLVVGPPGDTARIDDLGRRLCGEVLEHDNQPRALLTVLPKSDWVLRQYTGESEVWSTVVPAVFPGHHKGDRVTLCVRPEQLRVAARDGKPGANQPSSSLRVGWSSR